MSSIAERFGQKCVSIAKLMLKLDAMHDNSFWQYICEDVVFIGPMGHQLCISREDYQKAIATDMVFWFERQHQEYEVAYADEDCAVVLCTFLLTNSDKDSIFLLIKQRLTMFFIADFGEPKLKHMHISDPHIIDEQGNERPYNAGEELIAYIKSLTEDAHRDEMTGLLNRNYLESSYEALNRRFLCNGEGMVLFFDLNGFKEINDKHGHAAGDFVITALASALLDIKKSLLGDRGAVIRYGGDEFLLIADGTQVSQVGQVIAAVKKAFLGRLTPAFQKISFSIGFALNRTRHTLDLKELISLADRRMLRCKRILKRTPAFRTKGLRLQRVKS